MQNKNSADGLRQAILQLERRQAEEGKMLRKQFHLAYESINPLNLIKGIFKEAAASPDFKENFLHTSVGLTAGYLSKKLFEGASGHPMKKLLGSVLMFGVTNLVTKNPGVVKTFLEFFMSGPAERVNGTLVKPG